MALSFFFRRISPAYLIATVLFFIPFFWFPDGAMDLGGDGNRLYFYDPPSFIRNVSLYNIDSEGKGNVEQRHAYLVYVGFIAVLKFLFGQPHTVIALFNGLKLSLGFLSMYLITRDLLPRVTKKQPEYFAYEASAMLAGIFYIFATASERLSFFWSKALHSHDQIFLNPFMFFLVLRYLLTRNAVYLWGSLLVSFIFSLDVSMNSAPPVFAFYPISLAFLLLYVRYVRKMRIPVRELLTGFVVFIGLQSFHLVPSIASLIAPGSIANSIVFKESVTGGVNYFMAVRGLGKASISFFTPSVDAALRWTGIVPPAVLVLGFLLERKKRTDMLLAGAFFLLTFFLVSANITDTGLEIYRRLFYIPGFSMFRNFSSQWAYIFLFFYALLFGLSYSVILMKVKRRGIVLSASIAGAVLLAGYWPLLTGKLVDRVLWGSKNVKSAFTMDPRFVETLGAIRALPEEGKMLVLPLTDNFNQVVYGLNDAAYLGPSPISILTSKKTFGAYQIFYPNPIPETIMKLSREKNYSALQQIFSLFNIRYVFWNSDPRIYEEKFPEFPNSYMMTSLPKTQAEYAEFLTHFPLTMLYDNGPFRIYELDQSVYRPEVYVPDDLHRAEFADMVGNADISSRSAFIANDLCQRTPGLPSVCSGEYDPPGVTVSTKKISPVSYVLDIVQTGNSAPFMLVFQNSYHKDWRLAIGGRSVPESRHIVANTYANAWIVTPEDHGQAAQYSATLSLETQRYFRYGLLITGISVCILLYLFANTIRRNIRT